MKPTAVAPMILLPAYLTFLGLLRWPRMFLSLGSTYVHGPAFFGSSWAQVTSALL